MKGKEVLIKIVDVPKESSGYVCDICKQGGAVAKIVYIYAKFKNGVLVTRQNETGEWTAQWEDSFSSGVRIDCCLDCFEKFVDKIKKL